MSRPAVLRPLALVVALTVMWVALWGDLTVANVVGGIAVALVALALFRGVAVDAPITFRPMAAARFAGWFLVQLVRSNLVIAGLVVRRRIGDRTIVTYRAHTANPTLVTLLANALTLTPGTLSVDVDVDGDTGGRSLLTIHTLQARRAPDAALATVRAIEWRLLRAFGPPGEAAAADPRRTA